MLKESNASSTATSNQMAATAGIPAGPSISPNLTQNAGGGSSMAGGANTNYNSNNSKGNGKPKYDQSLRLQAV